MIHHPQNVTVGLVDPDDAPYCEQRRVSRDVGEYGDTYWEAHQLLIKTIKTWRGWQPYYVLTRNG